MVCPVPQESRVCLKTVPWNMLFYNMHEVDAFLHHVLVLNSAEHKFLRFMIPHLTLDTI